jgi:esterase/lipase superfamily enzyme
MSPFLRFLALSAAVVAWVPVAVLAGSDGPGRSEDVSPTADGVSETGKARTRVEVLYATNRARLEVAEPGKVFGGQRGEPAFGLCEVEFKPIPGVGGIAEKVPFYLPSESKALRIEEQVHEGAFWDRLRVAAAATTSGHVVVFIHGYSYDFERACDRAAEAQRVLADEATVLLFTWPSNGRPTDYASDATDLEWSVPFLMKVLRQVSDLVGAEQVQVLAHSLGSRGVVEAMLGLKSEGLSAKLLNQLVLLAPDLDAASFVDVVPELDPLAGGITLYASGNDTPLKFSRQLNGSPRLGQAGEFLTVIEGVETVDVTPAGRYQILGHEYFYYHPLVAADLAELVTTGSGAADRSVPRPRSRDGLTYWEIVAEEKE